MDSGSPGKDFLIRLKFGTKQTKNLPLLRTVLYAVPPRVNPERQQDTYDDNNSFSKEAPPLYLGKPGHVESIGDECLLWVRSRHSTAKSLGGWLLPFAVMDRPQLFFSGAMVSPRDPPFDDRAGPVVGPRFLPAESLVLALVFVTA